MWLDTHLLHKITVMSCNRAMLSTCKEIYHATPLHDRVMMAMRENDLDIKSALSKAIRVGARIEIIQSLLDHASWDESVVLKAIRNASMYGHLHIVQFLVTRIDDMRSLQSTIIVACKHGHTAIVHRLLQAGAYVDIRSWKRHVLLILSPQRDTSDIRMFLESSVNMSTAHWEIVFKCAMFYCPGFSKIVVDVAEANGIVIPDWCLYLPTRIR